MLTTAELIQLARDRYPVDMTHWDGCELDHDECLIKLLADEIERLQDALVKRHLP